MGSIATSNPEAAAQRPPHPQVSFIETTLAPESFFGKLRQVYSNEVLTTQLNALKRQGSYDAFKLEWIEPTYSTRRIYGAKALTNGLPPSLFWESDIGKWIESACYYLATNELTGQEGKNDGVFKGAIEELVDMIKKAQQPDGYLNVYFTVVDKEGKFQNLRDMHEMYNAGHLLEGALAHYHYTGKRDFLDVMIRNIECFAREFGPAPDQKPGYPGHPELELAVLRLADLTKDPAHRAFGEHLLAARGTQMKAHGGLRFFDWEAKQRKDEVYGCWMENIHDYAYHQAHKPLHEQDAILGHSVRAFYLLTAAADFGGQFTKDAQRLWNDATLKKMYVTGGFGSEPRSEGFSPLPYYLPESTGDGGCYCETCASIAAMMTGERLLSHELNGTTRDVLELSLYNAVLGGGSLDGKGFSYANVMATYGDESALRSGWFEVCCCPPNLSRTVALLGGYIWAAQTSGKDVTLTVYIFASAERSISLDDGTVVKIKMETEVPWKGKVAWTITAPEGVNVTIRVPTPSWAENMQLSLPAKDLGNGFQAAQVKDHLQASFDMPIRLLANHAEVNQDVLVVSRGPLIYVAEDRDNDAVEKAHKHFNNMALSENAKFVESEVNIVGNIDVIALKTQDVYSRLVKGSGLWNPVQKGQAVREWKQVPEGLTFIPWFARASRGGRGHLRVPFQRLGDDSRIG